MASDGGVLGVVGAGVMGVGVAHAFARAGCDVVLVDRDGAALERARGDIPAMERLSALLTSSGARPDALLRRVQFASDVEALAPVSYLIENITESWEAKRTLYEALDQVCRPDCIFAANTSAIPIGKLGGCTRRADRVIGIHFMNPVALKGTVEVIAGAQTSPATIERTRSLLERIEKKAIFVGDSPGFVSNRVLMLTVNEAICVVQESVASAADVDAVFRECFGHKMGPLETADLIGLDTILNSLIVLRDELGDRFQPCALLQDKVRRGELGRKTGVGFYRYAAGRKVS